jgi:hypothetical protein
MLRIAMLLLVAAMSIAQGAEGRATIEGRAIILPPGFSCGNWINAPEHTVTVGSRLSLRH